MKFSDPKTFLWGNICRLVGAQEKYSIDDVQARVGVGRGTVQRIKEGEAATRLSSLTTIAERLGVPTWRLLQDEPAHTDDAENLARLCDSITDWAERERFIVVTEHYAKLAISGRLGAVLDGIYLAAPASGTTTAPVLDHAPQTDADPATQSGQPGVAR